MSSGERQCATKAWEHASTLDSAEANQRPFPSDVALLALSFSSVCLVLDGLDPVDAVVSEDRTAVVATKTSIVVAKDNTQVSALAADYEPQCVSRHPSRPEYAVGGKVSGHGGRWTAGDSAWLVTLVLTPPPGQQGPHPLPQWVRAERGQDC